MRSTPWFASLKRITTLKTKMGASTRSNGRTHQFRKSPLTPHDERKLHIHYIDTR